VSKAISTSYLCSYAELRLVRLVLVCVVALPILSRASDDVWDGCPPAEEVVAIAQDVAKTMSPEAKTPS